MYNAHFGLNEAPFRITPDTRLFFNGAGRGEVLEALVYAITSGEGIIKVVGEVGTGKTMLCRMLEERLPEHVEMVYLVNPSLSSDDILHAIALEMGLHVGDDASRMQIMHALQAALLEKHAQNRQVVVFIEEAQAMPIETLEEVRLLSNLETKRDKLLQIAMFGQPELDRKLALPEIRQLKERITHGFYLPPLSRADMRNYIQFRLGTAGYRGPDLFSRRAYDLVHKASRGLTRRVNIIVDKMLLAAYAQNTHSVSARHARTAIEDSQFHIDQGWFSGRNLSFATVLLVLLLIGGGLFALTQHGAILDVFKRLTPGTVADVATLPEQPSAKGNVVGATLTASSATPVARTKDRASPVQSANANDVNSARGWSVPSAQRSVENLSPADGPQPGAFALRLRHSVAREQSGKVWANAVQAASPGVRLTVDGADSDALVEALESSDAPAAGMPVTAMSRPFQEPDRRVSLDVSTQSVAPPARSAVAVRSQPQSAQRSENKAGTLQPAVTSTDLARLVEARMVATEEWLSNVEGRRLSIQLMVAKGSQRKGLEAFLNENFSNGLDGVYVYQTLIKGKPWFGVMYGDFASLTEARAALAALPPRLRRHQPFIRNVADIRARS